MSKSKRNRTRKAARQDDQRLSRAVVRSRKRAPLILFGVFAVFAGIAVLAFAFTGNPLTDSSSARTSQAEEILTASNDSIKPASLEELLALPDADLAKVDLAVMNLLCAEGLPGTEQLDVMECSAVLDNWAETVRFETERHLYKFRQAPQDYENSEGFFRMLMLNTVLQQDFGVHYNLERMREIDFSNSKDLFIHGMINDANGGTCASMPVLVTAVARRLGYPVKLTTAKAHVFCRWEAPGDRINLEPSGRGLNTYPDEYYKTWPLPASEAEIKANRYLVSLTPREELNVPGESRPLPRGQQTPCRSRRGIREDSVTLPRYGALQSLPRRRAKQAPDDGKRRMAKNRSRTNEKDRQSDGSLGRPRTHAALERAQFSSEPDSESQPIRECPAGSGQPIRKPAGGHATATATATHAESTLAATADGAKYAVDKRNPVSLCYSNSPKGHPHEPQIRFRKHADRGLADDRLG